MWLFRFDMLHYVHQVLGNFISLQFSAERTEESGFIRAFLLKRVLVKRNGSLNGSLN